MAKECSVCGKSVGIFTSIEISDGRICMDCWAKAGFDGSMNTLRSSSQYLSSTFKEIIATKEKTMSLLENFRPTKNVAMLSFDDHSQIFVITKSDPFVKIKKTRDLYYYNQIVDFELLEDGESITKGGVGRAIVGDLLFGPVGAVVGAVTGGKKTRGICTSLQIKITFRDSARQTEYLNFIDTPIKTNSQIYKSAYQSAQEVLSALQLAVDDVNKSFAGTPAQQVVTSADEILKYKGLLDAGIITEEEFETKKAQLLGI